MWISHKSIFVRIFIIFCSILRCFAARCIRCVFLIGPRDRNPYYSSGSFATVSLVLLKSRNGLGAMPEAMLPLFVGGGIREVVDTGTPFAAPARLREIASAIFNLPTISEPNCLSIRCFARRHLEAEAPSSKDVNCLLELPQTHRRHRLLARRGCSARLRPPCSRTQGHARYRWRLQ